MAASSFRLIAMAGVLALVCAGTAAAQPSHPAPAPHAVPATHAQHAWRVYAVDSVQLRDLAAIVRIVPEARRDILARVANTGPLPAPTFRTSHGRLVVDGGVRRGRRGIADCDPGTPFSVELDGRGDVEGAALPRIELRVPEDVVLSSEGAVQITVAPAKSLRLNLVGCGEVDVERVRDSADVSVAGGDVAVRIYEAGSAALRVAGGGDVMLGAIRDGLDISVAGSGDVVVTRADGPTNIAIQGSGDVLIRSGRATNLTVAIAGSGDVMHQGSAERLSAAVIGSGDVHVRRVSGSISRRILGSGEVVVEDQ